MTGLFHMSELLHILVYSDKWVNYLGIWSLKKNENSMLYTYTDLLRLIDDIYGWPLTLREEQVSFLID